ncbi:MAG TPA: NAD-dependent epimerase/dehydratase family protein [Thermoanaerobaculia bacterium]|nr:NAD-dependent epimerase/dehydratase family protein [Thermoanaerobaculia bacterium]
MRVFITGIGGFVGSRLARHLLAQGDRVSGTYIGPAPSFPDVDLHEVDLLDREALQRAVAAADPDAIVNLAGLSHIGESWEWSKMSDYFWVNVVGTENVLAAAAGRPVVIASSADVYGSVPREEQPIPEDRRIAPQTPYALTKAAAERLAQGGDRGKAVIVRSFNLIGPGQSPNFALPRWASKLAEIRRDKKPAILETGDLSTSRDMVHVDDGAAAYRLLAEKGNPGTVYNLSSGRAVQMRHALDRLQAISGVTVEVKEGVFSPRPFDIPYLSGDASRLRALGWEPLRTLDDALADLWKEANP